MKQNFDKEKAQKILRKACSALEGYYELQRIINCKSNITEEQHKDIMYLDSITDFLAENLFNPNEVVAFYERRNEEMYEFSCQMQAERNQWYQKYLDSKAEAQKLAHEVVTDEDIIWKKNLEINQLKAKIEELEETNKNLS